jgi:thiamine-phosphate diphosphorylase
MLPRLHLVTDAAVLQDVHFLDAATAALECCGVRCALHLRGHGMTGAQLHELGTALGALALRTGAWLIVNDRVDVAMAVRANGVQLGRRSLPVADARALLGAGARIGRSVHGAAEADEARIDGADFVVLGSIYETASHADLRPLGAAVIEDAVRAGLPVVAIGGITPGRVPEVARAGAHGVAVLGGVWRAADAAAAAAEYVAALDAAWSSEKS